MAAYPDPPPVIPLPESLAAQGPYVRLPCPGLARARNVSRHWGPPRACYRVPCCETLKRGTPVAPRRVQGGLSGSPRIRAGTKRNKQRTEIPRPSSPAGTAAAECPEEEEPPAWEAPTAQISQRAPSPQGRGRLTMRHKAAKQTSSSAWKWRGKKGREGWVLAATSALPPGSGCIRPPRKAFQRSCSNKQQHSNIFDNTDSIPSLTVRPQATVI